MYNITAVDRQCMPLESLWTGTENATPDRIWIPTYVGMTGAIRSQPPDECYDISVV